MTTTTNATPDIAAVVQAATETLTAAHIPAVRNDWGSCTKAGFSVNPGADGRARVHHQLPRLSFSDPNRLSGQARWAECRARVNEYAATLRAAGWTVEEKTITSGAILLASPPRAVTADDIRFTYTNPITSRRVSRDEGRRYVAIGDAVLEIEHTYRSHGLWTASLYSDHLDSRAAIEWFKSDGQVFLFAHRRSDLVTAIAQYVGTEEWRQKLSVWLQLPKEPRGNR